MSKIRAQPSYILAVEHPRGLPLGRDNGNVRQIETPSWGPWHFLLFPIFCLYSCAVISIGWCVVSGEPQHQSQSASRVQCGLSPATVRTVETRATRHTTHVTRHHSPPSLHHIQPTPQPLSSPDSPLLSVFPVRKNTLKNSCITKPNQT